MRKIIARLAVVALPLGLMTGLGLGLASPAQAASWNAWCDNEVNILCMHMDGTAGDNVLGKIYSSNQQTSQSSAETAITGPCGNGVSKVQDGGDGDDNCNGATYWWPSTLHNIDTGDGAGNVYVIYNVSSGNCLLGTTAGNADVQDTSSCNGTGRLWIQLTDGTDLYEEVNVYVTDTQNDNLNYELCSGAAGDPLTTGVSGGCAFGSNKTKWSFVASG